jgi:hypothetical protein
LKFSQYLKFRSLEKVSANDRSFRDAYDGVTAAMAAAYLISFEANAYVATPRNH